MKLNSYYPEPITAWAVINANFPDIPTSGTTFSKVSSNVVQVNRTAHGLTNGMWVSFDGLTSTQAYLNGTWEVFNVLSNSFQFTVTVTVPEAPTQAIIRATKLLKKFNVSKVGKLALGKYRVYFDKLMDDTDYAVLSNALLLQTPAGSVSILENNSYCDIQTTDTSTKAGADIAKLHVAVIGGIN